MSAYSFAFHSDATGGIPGAVLAQMGLAAADEEVRTVRVQVRLPVCVCSGCCVGYASARAVLANPLSPLRCSRNTPQLANQVAISDTLRTSNEQLRIQLQNASAARDAALAASARDRAAALAAEQRAAAVPHPTVEVAQARAAVARAGASAEVAVAESARLRLVARQTAEENLRLRAELNDLQALLARVAAAHPDSAVTIEAAEPGRRAALQGAGLENCELACVAACVLMCLVVCCMYVRAVGGCACG